MTKDDKILALEERIIDLEDALGTSPGMCDAYQLLGLTRVHRKVLGVLMTQDEVSKDKLYSALYGDDKQPDPRVLSIHMHHVRQAIKPSGATVTTVWGAGWLMTGDDKRKLKDYLKAHLERVHGLSRGTSGSVRESVDLPSGVTESQPAAP